MAGTHQLDRATSFHSHGFLWFSKRSFLSSLTSFLAQCVHAPGLTALTSADARRQRPLVRDDLHRPAKTPPPKQERLPGSAAGGGCPALQPLRAPLPPSLYAPCTRCPWPSHSACVKAVPDWRPLYRLHPTHNTVPRCLLVGDLPVIQAQRPCLLPREAPSTTHSNTPPTMSTSLSGFLSNHPTFRSPLLVPRPLRCCRSLTCLPVWMQPGCILPRIEGSQAPVLSLARNDPEKAWGSVLAGQPYKQELGENVQRRPQGAEILLSWPEQGSHVHRSVITSSEERGRWSPLRPIPSPPQSPIPSPPRSQAGGRGNYTGALPPGEKLTLRVWLLQRAPGACHRPEDNAGALHVGQTAWVLAPPFAGPQLGYVDCLQDNAHPSVNGR